MRAGLAVLVVLLAGCVDVAPAPPQVPEVGTSYRFTSSESGNFTLTYAGITLHGGRAWYLFDQAPREPYVGLRWVEVDTGGLPIEMTGGLWSEQTMPFMEWHRSEGRSSSGDDRLRRDIALDEDDGERTVRVVQLVDDEERQRDIVTYQAGDILPRTWVSLQGARPNGGWAREVTVLRVDGPAGV